MPAVNFRIGQSTDIHKLVEGRPLILGACLIPYERGLLGHSDADALLHSIIDAMLGALALGDIGQHFPDTDPKWKGVRSSEMLKYAHNLVIQAGWGIANIDATVVLQAPKLRPHIDLIRQSIATLLKLELDQVSVKATTAEGLGFVGEGLALQVYCCCLLCRS